MKNFTLNIEYTREVFASLKILQFMRICRSRVWYTDQRIWCRSIEIFTSQLITDDYEVIVSRKQNYSGLKKY